MSEIITSQLAGGNFLPNIPNWAAEEILLPYLLFDIDFISN